MVKFLSHQWMYFHLQLHLVGVWEWRMLHDVWRVGWSDPVEVFEHVWPLLLWML